MPKDEDILQLVSAALRFEAGDPWSLGDRIQPSPLGPSPCVCPSGR